MRRRCACCSRAVVGGMAFGFGGISGARKKTERNSPKLHGHPLLVASPPPEAPSSLTSAPASLQTGPFADRAPAGPPRSSAIRSKLLTRPHFESVSMHRTGSMDGTVRPGGPTLPLFRPLPTSTSTRSNLPRTAPPCRSRPPTGPRRKPRSPPHSHPLPSHLRRAYQHQRWQRWKLRRRSPHSSS